MQVPLTPLTKAAPKPLDLLGPESPKLFAGRAIERHRIFAEREAAAGELPLVSILLDLRSISSYKIGCRSKSLLKPVSQLKNGPKREILTPIL